VWSSCSAAGMGEAEALDGGEARDTVLLPAELSDDLMLDLFDPPQEADPTWWDYDMTPWDYLFPQIPF
jgi:hypothetical protein